MMLAIIQQTFRYKIPGEADVVWDIEHAKLLTRFPENVVQTVTMPPEMQAEVAAKNEWEEAHLSKVDPTRPGIGAPLYYEGQIIYVLIDGHHRNVRALREQTPFRVNLLSDEASRQCVVEGLEHPRMPWNLQKS